MQIEVSVRSARLGTERGANSVRAVDWVRKPNPSSYN